LRFCHSRRVPATSRLLAARNLSLMLAIRGLQFLLANFMLTAELHESGKPSDVK